MNTKEIELPVKFENLVIGTYDSDISKYCTHPHINVWSNGHRTFHNPKSNKQECIVEALEERP